ncbi:MAG: DUF3568 family protein [Phycisphaerales bacterium]|nr:DUF3568 family protein [Phycisphaerales bacterium]
MTGKARAHTLAAFLLLATLAWHGGCAAVVVYAYANGESTHDVNAPLDDVWAASLAAFDELELPVAASSRDEDSGRIKSRTPGGDEITLRLQQRKVDQTRAKVRIGLFGDEKRSQQIIRSIEGRLGLTAPADAAAPQAFGEESP